MESVWGGEGLALAVSPRSCQDWGTECALARAEQNSAELACEAPGASHMGQPHRAPGPWRGLDSCFFLPKTPKSQ